MKITRENLKNIVREAMVEESAYQEFFKKALEKAGKSIPEMSDEEKKAFFNKIDKSWNGKGEKKEIVETELEEAQSPAQKAAFAKMLAKKDGKDESTDDEKKEVKESVNEASGVKVSKDGYVKHIKHPMTGKMAKSVKVNGKEYRYNSVYKTYNSVKGNELLDKSNIPNIRYESVKESIIKEEVKESNINEDKVSNGTVSTLEKGIQRILGTKVNHDINRNGAHEFYIDDAEFVIGVNDGTEKKVAYSFSIYDDGARKYLGKGTSADEKDLIKQVLSIVKKYKKQLLLTTESVSEAAPKMKKSAESEKLQKVYRAAELSQKGGSPSRYSREFESAKKKALKYIGDMITYTKIGK